MTVMGTVIAGVMVGMGCGRAQNYGDRVAMGRNSLPCHSLVQSHLSFRELSEISLYFGCRYSVGSLDIDFIFGILVGLTEALHQQ